MYLARERERDIAMYTHVYMYRCTVICTHVCMSICRNNKTQQHKIMTIIQNNK